MDNFKVVGNVVGVPNPKTDTYSKTEINDMLSTNADKLNSLKYYGDINIVPSDASLFTFTTDDETMTASVSAASKGISGDIVIPYQYVADDKVYLVTSVAENGFAECTRLTGVKMPNSLKIIGNFAFYDCYGLNSINIPYGVTHIWNYAFSYTQMAEVDIPDSVTYIGEYAFYGCTQLIRVDIPDSVTYMGTQVFSECIALEEVALSKNLTDISSGLFKDCSTLKKIDISDNVTSINNGAFDGCVNLIGINIPDSVTNLGKRTFTECSNIVDITIPSSITNIGDYSFEGCSALSNVYYTGTENEWNAMTISTTGNDPLLSATIHYNWVPAKKNYVDEKIGDLETVLDNIIAIQNTLMGGGSE